MNMISEFKELIKNAADLGQNLNTESDEKNLVLALGVLMLEMAGADNDYAPEEVKTCFRNLEKIFLLSDTEALDILEKAEGIRTDKEKVSELIESINKSFSSEQKVLILSLIWKVVVADQKIEKNELRYANQLRVRLQLTEDEGEEARKMAFGGSV